MGCLKALFVQVGCLVLVVAAAVLGFLYRDRVSAAWRSLRGLPPRAEVVYAAPASGEAERARQALEELSRRGGAAFVDLTAAQVAALVDEELGRGRARSFDSVAVGLAENSVRLRGRLDLSEVPQRLLGPLASALERREPVSAGGPLAADSAGRLLWTVTSLRVREFPFPRSTIAAVLRSLGVTLADDGAIALPVPAAVGDVRVSPERVRLYRASPR